MIRLSVPMSFAVLFSLLGTSSNVSGQKQIANSVVVNGQEIPSKVIDGELYIRPEDVARALRATLSYTGSAVVINTGVPPQEVKVTGTIKGTLTYYFNANYGNRPDSGSEIWLVSEDIVINKDEFNMALGEDYVVGNIPSGKRFKVLKHTMADGNGNFELTGIPEGQYSVIMRSNHVHCFGLRDSIGKTLIKRVNVKTGELADVSTDFGMSDF